MSHLSVLRKQPAAPLLKPPVAQAVPERPSAEPEAPRCEPGAPLCLLDPATWALTPAAVAELLSGSNQDFSVVGCIGAQGLGKSAFLNRLLALDAAGALAAAAATSLPPSPAFAVSPLAAGGLPALQHGTRGVQLAVSADRIIGLDSQPLFSASVLEEMACRTCDQPPPALAAPAVAAASEAKAAAVPFEGAQALAQLQMAVLLLTACHRLLVFCDGLEDRRTWELILTAEMLARGVPDPSLPPRDATSSAGGGSSQQPGMQQPTAAGAAGASASWSQQQQAGRPRLAAGGEHLAEVVLVHVISPSSSSSSNGGLPGSAAGGGPGAACCGPSAAELADLEARLAAFFSGSRLCRPRPLSMLRHLHGEPATTSSNPSSSSLPSSGTGSDSPGMSYWVLPAPSHPSSTSSSDALVAALLSRPCPPLARPCSETVWLKGVGEAWGAVRRSSDIAAFYSRLARTQLKGAGGWGLVR